MPSRHQLRCYCSKNTFLALYGINERGLLFVHMKVYKGDRVFGEIVVTGGEVKIRCRDCHRWYRVVIRQPGDPVLRRIRGLPPEVEPV